MANWLNLGLHHSQKHLAFLFSPCTSGYGIFQPATIESRQVKICSSVGWDARHSQGALQLRASTTVV
jgi:hypothetical protein